MNTNNLNIGDTVYDRSAFDFHPVEILEIINENSIKVIEHGLPSYYPENKIRILDYWYLEPESVVWG